MLTYELVGRAMNSFQLLILNGQVACLLMLGIPCVAAALHLILRHPRTWTRWGRVCMSALLIGALFLYDSIGQLVLSAYAEGFVVRVQETTIVFHKGVLQDSIACVALPSVLGVACLVACLRRYVRHLRL